MSETDWDLPRGFTDLVKPALGAELPDFLVSLRLPPRRALRFSSRRTSPDFSLLAGSVAWAKNAWYIPEGFMPGTNPLHWAGAYYIQEPSAMAVATALDPRPGERVLDLCAAPGGKACQLADMMGGRGLLLANEPIRGRALELSRNVERMGLRNVIVSQETPERLAGFLPEFFDRILVDAPCSGEGMFRKDSGSRGLWSPESPEACAKRQRRILACAAGMLKPGGALAYSTCTFNMVENEDVIAHFLRHHPDFYPSSFSLPGLRLPREGMLRIWPHQSEGEGHFIALMKKRGEQNFSPHPESSVQATQTGELRNIQRMANEWVTDPVRLNAFFCGFAVQAPEILPVLNTMNVLRMGLHAADKSRKTIRPEHALALSASPRQVIGVSYEEANRYRMGEELACGEALAGFTAPALSGWPLGWGKAVGGRLKNHYPKGLRKLGLGSRAITPDF